jgi:hypothetical protein
MKKSIFLAAGLLCCASSLFAQQTLLGLRAGYTLSDVLVKEPDGLTVEGNPDFEIDEHYRPLHSFHIGIDARMQMGERLGIIASLLYARKGYKSTLNWPGGTADASWELHYLNLPLTVDFRVWKGLCLQAGVEAGWLIEARVKSNEESFDPNNLFPLNEFDFGLVGGLEYRFVKGFFIGARYIAGVAPLLKFELTGNNGETLGDVTSRNSATQISMGYRYIFDE